MDREAIRTHCLSFAGVTEQLQWGADLLYKVSGKMFVVTNMAPDPISLSLKASSERFYELLERAGVRPAPYLARAQWVRVDPENDLSWSELQALIAESYALVTAKLPKSKRPGATPKLPTKKKLVRAAKRTTSKTKRAAAKPKRRPPHKKRK